MNAIDNALADIREQIPRFVLEKTFLSNFKYTTTIPISVDARIKELVIYGRVIKDCNIVGGTHITIPLEGLNFEWVDMNAAVVRIPKSRTQGRSITSVYSVAMTAATLVGATASPLMPTSEVGNAYQQMLNAVASLPYMSEAQVMLIADNTVMIQNLMSMAGGLYLRCEVENDHNLNNIKRRSYFAFSEACVLATKAYIYNNNVIPMDIAFIEGGASLGEYKNIVDSYSDANTEYKEYMRVKWAKVARLNDAETIEQLVRMTAGGMY